MLLKKIIPFMKAVKEVEVKRKYNFNIIKSIIITPLSNIKLNGKYITPLPQSFCLCGSSQIS